MAGGGVSGLVSAWRSEGERRDGEEAVASSVREELGVDLG